MCKIKKTCFIEENDRKNGIFFDFDDEIAVDEKVAVDNSTNKKKFKSQIESFSLSRL